jgi:hypothetical protein
MLKSNLGFRIWKIIKISYLIYYMFVVPSHNTTSILESPCLTVINLHIYLLIRLYISWCQNYAILVLASLLLIIVKIIGEVHIYNPSTREVETGGSWVQVKTNKQGVNSVWTPLHHILIEGFCFFSFGCFTSRWWDFGGAYEIVSWRASA